MSDDETPAPLIRTGTRDKLPRGLSHPVGAEIISRALAGCPQYDELWTAFSRWGLGNIHMAQGFRAAFSVVCNNQSGSWYLRVPAVPGEKRALVRQLLLETGLPVVRDWLCQPRTETWYEGFRTFDIGYAVEPLRICFVESLNDRMIDTSVVAVESD